MKKDKIWIAAVDLDSFNYVPVQEFAEDVVRAKLNGYYRKANCQKECDHLNSL